MRALKYKLRGRTLKVDMPRGTRLRVDPDARNSWTAGDIPASYVRGGKGYWKTLLRDAFKKPSAPAPSPSFA